MSSTISTNLPNLHSLLSTSATEQAATTAETSSTPSYTPLWLVRTAGSLSPSESIGIRLPSASGDLSVMLAQVSLSLEQSIDESQANRAKSQLQALAASLNQYNLEALAKDAGNKEATVSETTETLADLKKETEPLLAEQSSWNGVVAARRSEVAAIEQALANPKLTDEERAKLQADLAAAQSQLSSALASREAVDIKLAQARIANLDAQAADLEAQLARAVPESDEAKAIQAQLDAKRAEAGAARNALAAFQAGPRSEAARDAFSAEIHAQVTATTSELETRLAGYQAALAAAKLLLQETSALALAVIAATMTRFFAADNAQMSADAMRDQGIETIFEKIAETLDESSEASIRLFAPEIDHAAEGEEKTSNQRALATALGLVAALAGLLSTLAGQLGTPEAPLPVPLDTTGSRVRVAV